METMIRARTSRFPCRLHLKTTATHTKHNTRSSNRLHKHLLGSHRTIHTLILVLTNKAMKFLMNSNRVITVNHPQDLLQDLPQDLPHPITAGAHRLQTKAGNTSKVNSTMNMDDQCHLQEGITIKVQVTEAFIEEV